MTTDSAVANPILPAVEFTKMLVALHARFFPRGDLLSRRGAPRIVWRPPAAPDLAPVPLTLIAPIDGPLIPPPNRAPPFALLLSCPILGRFFSGKYWEMFISSLSEIYMSGPSTRSIEKRETRTRALAVEVVDRLS